MPLIGWTGPARSDLRAIDRWLNEEASGDFAVRTLSAIRQRAMRLVDFPHVGRPGPGDIRVLRVLETPYIILYRIAGGQVQILRIRHEREDWLIAP